MSFIQSLKGNLLIYGNPISPLLIFQTTPLKPFFTLKLFLLTYISGLVVIFSFYFLSEP